MKIEKELAKHILDDNWRSYGCGCRCWHSEDNEIHAKELNLTELNEMILP